MAFKVNSPANNCTGLNEKLDILRSVCIHFLAESFFPPLTVMPLSAGPS